ncbi:uncharacterized protein LOC144818244 isoform X2 [Lissotriton helveticus]
MRWTRMLLNASSRHFWNILPPVFFPRLLSPQGTTLRRCLPRRSKGIPRMLRTMKLLRHARGGLRAPRTLPKATIADMLDLDDIVHPRSAEWVPAEKAALYLASRLRKPLENEARSRLRAECPRPTLEGKVSIIPDIESKMATFLAKFIKEPKKGIDRSWRACQDKLLDITGPLAKILDMAEEARVSGSLIYPEVLSAWAQQAICFVGNANCALSTERRRSLLIKVNPKLGDLAGSEAGASAQGALNGEQFIKELGKFVATFTSLDKAQANIKHVFTPRVFRGAGLGRSRPPGRGQNQQPLGRGQGSGRGQYHSDQRFTNFYPTRGQRVRGRGYRGNETSSNGECFTGCATAGWGQAGEFFPRL